MKKCEQCEYQKYNKIQDYWYCEVAELDEDIAAYWNDEEDKGECYGYQNYFS
jgi:hypothetical protein